MIDLSELNYKQLIELEKEIQKEKAKKVGDHLTKTDLTWIGKSKEIMDILDPKFQNARYGYPQEDWKTSAPDVEYFNSQSDDVKQKLLISWERPDVTRLIHTKVTSSITYLCDIAFENYRDYVAKTHDGKPKSKYMTISINKEIPWKKADSYKAMYDEICNIFIKYAKGESNAET